MEPESVVVRVGRAELERWRAAAEVASLTVEEWALLQCRAGVPDDRVWIPEKMREEL